jgi:signal transduction histidine kinase
MRIARELHDSAGHALSVMLVQAGAARLLHESDPQASKRALSTVEDVARSTIDEIDRLVSALREEGEGGAEPSPPAGTGDIDELAERHRESGLEVTVRHEGRRDHERDPGVDRAAYRIVQEALTNAARHGDGAADVLLRFGEEGLELSITNPVADGEASEGGGHGLVGMRERAALLGGRLEADREDGVFRVHAELPYGGAHP